MKVKIHEFLYTDIYGMTTIFSIPFGNIEINEKIYQQKILLTYFFSYHFIQ